LRLEQIEKLRTSLTKVSNETKSASKEAVAADSMAKTEFLRAVGIASFSKEALLKEVNTRRSILQLPELTDLEKGTSLKGGIIVAAGKPDPKPEIKKVQALADHKALMDRLSETETDALLGAKTRALEILETLRDNPELSRSLKRRVLLRTGLELIDDPECPLCETVWDIVELRAHLQEKIQGAKEASELLATYEKNADAMIIAIKALEQDLTRLKPHFDASDPKVDSKEIEAARSVLEGLRTVITDFAKDPSDPEGAITAFSSDWRSISSGASEAIAALKVRIDALPDASKEEEARDYLVVAQERYERCSITNTANEEAKKLYTTAQSILAHYETSSTTVLEGVYQAVEKDFTAFYRAINDDESTFNGKLEPSLGKLGFDVDFYGRGLFPPGAYHSEGHQDGMGLCLYLALMKHTLGSNFAFAVLDDVLMSVDSGHRREVCALLKKEFAQTQFVLTTHDPVWLQFMRSEGLITASVGFSGWSVDTGPNVWSDGDIWQKIDEMLAKNDVPGAAAALRRYLEYTANILADNLRAPVQFRADGQYDFGDLMPPALRAWKNALTQAKEAALSWAQNDEVKKIEVLQQTANTRVATTNVDQWMVNKAVHYTNWGTLRSEEFTAIVKSYKELLEAMRCSEPECGGYLFISPPKGTAVALRCSCGKISLNLNKK
ncbi:MAG: chromosome segregation protein SMC, partial [Candidatus Paceibacterota bacterium]